MNRLVPILFFAIAGFLLMFTGFGSRTQQTDAKYKLPERGLCAHRGAMETHPENTLAAFREAIKSGAHMIEFDVQLTKDYEPVVIHDNTVDRTTNGTGRVSDFTLQEIRLLDAGSWKSPEFKGERIPTLSEALQIMPLNVWLNVHLKGSDVLGRIVAEHIVAENRLHQAVLACLPEAAITAKAVAPSIMICNMDRKQTNREYIDATIAMKADFIQLRGNIYPGFKDYAKALKENGIRINYFGTDSPEEIRALFGYGVDFPLVNNISQSMKTSVELGIMPVKPLFPK
jgi:glycerophosphoryl diester phosphodiesterase